MKVDVELVGVPEMIEALNAVSKRVANAAMREALNEGAPIIVNAAKGLVRSETGALRDSITYKLVTGRGEGRYGHAIIGPSSKAVYQTPRGKRKPSRYAHLVEFGAAPHSLARKGLLRKLGRRLTGQAERMHPGTEAKPFLRPAVDMSRSTVFAVMTAVIRRHVVDEARKQKRKHDRALRRAAMKGSA